ncbi:MAG: single-stranded DNA-binding protein [Bacteroidota bacterium]
MINKVTLVGNLGGDPEIRHFEGGGKATRFSLATNENYQDRNNEWQTRTEWHRVVCWGAMAERAEKQLTKGNLVYIEGKITSRKWQDKEGVERTTVEIVAATYRLLERRESGASAIPNTEFPSPQEQVPTTTAKTETISPVDDDLPF